MDRKEGQKEGKGTAKSPDDHFTRSRGSEVSFRRCCSRRGCDATAQDLRAVTDGLDDCGRVKRKRQSQQARFEWSKAGITFLLGRWGTKYLQGSTVRAAVSST